jgi:hypothetical protein
VQENLPEAVVPVRFKPQLNWFRLGGNKMEDHVYKVLELVGSSEKSIEDAIQNADGMQPLNGCCLLLSAFTSLLPLHTLLSSRIG